MLKCFAALKEGFMWQQLSRYCYMYIDWQSQSTTSCTQQQATVARHNKDYILENKCCVKTCVNILVTFLLVPPWAAALTSRQTLCICREGHR